MTFKTLLLGSAAAMMVAGSAQAADLAVAEPVDYVKVCNAFGNGYWYSPGTQTCVKIGGYVNFTAYFGDNEGGGLTPGVKDDHVFVSEGQINLTTKTMTEWGPLTTYIAFTGTAHSLSRADTNHTPGVGPGGRFHEPYRDRDVDLSAAYIELGPLLVGHTVSTYDLGGGFNVLTSGLRPAAVNTDQIRLSWAMNGFGIMLAAEDYRDRYYGATAGTGVSWGSAADINPPDGSMPDLVAAITASFAPFDIKLAAAYGSRTGGLVNTSVPGGLGIGVVNTEENIWAVGARVDIKMDFISPGDRLRLAASYADGEGSYVGTNSRIAGDHYQYLASFEHIWNSQWRSAITYSHRDSPEQSRDRYTLSTTWQPVRGLEVSGEVQYQENDGLLSNADAWTGGVRFQRRF